MARQVPVSDITNQRTLTESADTTTDDTPETPVGPLDRVGTYMAEWMILNRIQRCRSSILCQKAYYGIR